MKKLLISCVPMISRINNYKKQLSFYDVTIPEIVQNMTEEKLLEIIADYDYWIVGDDPVTKNVLEKAKKLKILVKWGIGIDNIDLESISIPFFNTPDMFGNEVADVAIGYLLMLTRSLNQISNEVKKGNWYKPAGISLKDKKVGLIGFGNIGRNIADRLISLQTKIHVYDPGFDQENGKIKCIYKEISLDERLNDIIIENDIYDVFRNAKIIILACSSNKENYHMINFEKISLLENGAYIINISRGNLVDENAIVKFLKNEKLAGFASDVFETEPLLNSPFLSMDNVIVGSHNASNTIEAVDRTSLKAIELLNNI